MNYLMIILLSALYTFGICFIVQIRQNKNRNLSEKVKCCFPKGRENKILFSFVLFMLILCGVLLIYIYNAEFIDCIRLLTILAVLCPAAYTDWSEHIIANKLILIALCIRIPIFIAEYILNSKSAMELGTSCLISAGVIFVIGLLCSLVFKGSLGMGDVKLMAVMALFQGASGVICSVFVSLLVSFVYCIGALIMKKKQKRDMIPFAPSLLFGTYISICAFGF